tara:strand:- start:2198 stop:2488 length:291 start_codon:yes stop_codon:yes gene_type:complete
VGHHSARSANKLTYGLYSAGVSDMQKREIVEAVRLPGLWTKSGYKHERTGPMYLCELWGGAVHYFFINPSLQLEKYPQANDLMAGFEVAQRGVFCH